MAKIRISKIEEDKAIIELETTHGEVESLKGELSGIRFFAEQNNCYKSNIATRGKGNSTKYFLIPRELRDKLPNAKSIKCQRIKFDSKQWFVFEI